MSHTSLLFRSRPRIRRPSLQYSTRRLVFVLSAEQIRAVSSAPLVIELTVNEVIERSNANVSVSGLCEQLSAEAVTSFDEHAERSALA